ESLITLSCTRASFSDQLTRACGRRQLETLVVEKTEIKKLDARRPKKSYWQRKEGRLSILVCPLLIGCFTLSDLSALWNGTQRVRGCSECSEWESGVLHWTGL
ncbi:hypothetical protein MHYP_G00039320, partial [Metynnis hypsauchen]